VKKNSDFSTLMRSTAYVIKRRWTSGLRASSERLNNKSNEWTKTYVLCKTLSLSQSARMDVEPSTARVGAVGVGTVVIRPMNWKILLIAGVLSNDRHILFKSIISAHTAWNGIHYDSVTLELHGQGTASIP
jgi:hypothetical protein